MKHVDKIHPLAVLLTSVAAFILSIDSAQAYVGPGLGAGALGVVLGVIGSVFVAIFAVVWYPIKRILKKFRSPKRAEDRHVAKA